MSELTVEWFGPDDRKALGEWLALTEAVRLTDSPWRHERTLRGAERTFRHGWDGEPAVPFLARAGGEVVGWAGLSMSERDNLHFAHVSLAVHPAHRRRGHGGAILRVAEQAARGKGRTVVAADGEDSAAIAAFAARHGYERGSAYALRRQTLGDVDPAVVAAMEAEAEERSGDYYLERWPVPTAPDRCDQLAAMAGFINDSPTDDLEVEDEVFDADRTRAYEHAQTASGDRLLRLVARHRPTGDLAGQTVVAVETDRPHLGDQHDTTVVPTHRGHRLGLRLKVGMMHWLAEAEPQVRELTTGNAVSNDYMISINERLGYRLCGVNAVFQRRID